MNAAPAITAKYWPITGGRRTWSELVSLFNDLEAMWTDLDGLHVRQPLPAEPPAGVTHVWGWSDRRWARARVEGAQTFVAELCATNAIGESDELVQLCVGLLWEHDEARLSGIGRENMSKLANEAAWLLSVPGVAPITFLHLGDATW